MSRNSVKQGKEMDRFSVYLNPITHEIHALKQKALTAIHAVGYTLLLSHVGFIPYAHANPTGGTVVGGTGTITQSGVVTDIVQQSNAMAIDWSSYNLSSDEIVNYYQPDSSSLSLNRILSNDPSQINGQINANGQVILVNPNGLFFGDNASVNVGGLIASGLDISPDDFMNGNYIFNEVLGTNGTVINTGLINAATGGNVTLLGRQVQNQGVISANLGAVNMAAGKQAVLTFDNQGLIGISVTQDILQNELGVDPAILNSGEINASGGRILLTASQSRDIFSRAVNTGDLTQATSVVVNEDGSFDLTGGADVVNSGTLSTATTEANTDGGNIALLGQNVTSSGTINANAQQGNGGNIELHAVDTTLLTQNSITSARAETQGQGGIVKILGDKVGLFDQSQIDVSGANGGGQALIGGDYQGQNNLIRNASRTYVGTNSQIRADALDSGDGGKIINWGNEYTWFYGSATAKGGANSGNGGFVEISGKGLSFDGRVDTTAVNGNLGTLLFDPDNIVINNGSSGLNDSQVTTDATILQADGSGANFYISEGALESLGSGANIVLEATNDITIGTLYTDHVLDLAIDSSSGGSLTITANADNTGGGTFSMNAGDTIRTQGGSVSISGASVSVGSIDTQGISPTGGTSGNGTNGGAISLTSSAGNITVNGTLNSGGGAAADGASTGDTYVGGSAGTITLNSGTNNIILNDDITAVGGNGINGGTAGSGAMIGLTAANVQLNNNLLIEAGKAASVAINGAIDYNPITSGTLTVSAGDNITLASVADSNPGSDILNLSLNGNTDGDAVGAVQANGAITTQGGTLTIGGVSITTQSINTTGSATQSGGEVILTATATTGSTGINVGNVTTDGNSSGNGMDGGNVTLTSAGGTVDTGSISTRGSNGSGNFDDGGAAGTIDISNSGSITVTGSLTAIGGDAGASNATNGAGGDITIAGVTPSDAAGAVNISGNTTANSAAVTITAESISAGNITTTGNTTRQDDTGQAGGDVTLKATTDIGTGISVGAITAAGGNPSNNSNGENGGNVVVASAGGAIATGSINTSGSKGDGYGDSGGTAGTIGIYNSNSGTITVTGNLDANGNAGTGTGSVGAGNDITIAGVTFDEAGIPSGSLSYLTGSVSITGVGNGNVTAHGADVTINAASITANAIDTSGVLDQDGGAVALTASGGISVTSVTTNAGNRSSDGPGYQAGSITLDTTGGTGGITVTGTLSAKGGYFDDTGNDFGTGGAGGNVALNSGSGAIAVTGTINTGGNSANGSNNDGGAAGDIDITSASGTIAVTSLTANGGGEGNSGTGGNAGHIDLNTGSSATNAVTITGAVAANGGSSGNGTAGNADYISLQSDNGAMILQGNVSATGTNAANVTVSADSLQLSTTAAQNISGDTVTLTSTNSANVIQLQRNLSIAAATDTIFNGDLYAGIGASTLDVTAGRHVTLDGISTSGGPLAVTVDAGITTGDVTVNGNVNTARGKFDVSGLNYIGSSNTIITQGGAVTIDADSSITTGGVNSSSASIVDAGAIALTATNGDMSVSGNVVADGNTTNGTNASTIALHADNGTMSLQGDASATGATNANIILQAETVQLTGTAGQAINGNVIDISSTVNPLALQDSLTISAADNAIINGTINYIGTNAGSLGITANDGITFDGITATGKLDTTLIANNNGDSVGDVTVNRNVSTAGGNYEVSGEDYLGSSNNITTQGGLVTINTASIDTGDINTTGSAGQVGGAVILRSTANSGGGITVGAITTKGNVGSAGGNVSLMTTNTGDITINGAIDSSGSGTISGAGLVTVTSAQGNISVQDNVVANGNATGNAIYLQAANGTADIQGNLIATGSSAGNTIVTAQTVQINGGSAQTFNGNHVYILATDLLQLQQSLTVNAIRNALIYNDNINDGIDYSGIGLAGELNVSAGDYVQVGGNGGVGISGSGGGDQLDVVLNANTNGGLYGTVIMYGDISTEGGLFSAQGLNYDGRSNAINTGGGNATIDVSGNVLLGNMTVGGDLAVTAGGADGITQGSGTGLVVTGTSNFTSIASGANVVLTSAGNSLHGAIGADLAGDLTLINDQDIVVGSINSSDANGIVDLTTTNGRITADYAPSGTNITAARVVLKAKADIGSVINVLETSTSELNVQTDGGSIWMRNAGAGEVALEMMKAGSWSTANHNTNPEANVAGNIDFSTDGNIAIGRVEAGWAEDTNGNYLDGGNITLSSDNGGFTAYGPFPSEPFSYENSDVAGYATTFSGAKGGFGSLERRIVVYAPGDIKIITSISYSPILRPYPHPDGNISNLADLDISISDALSAVSGEQVTEIEELSDVDPAIFTEVHNYNLAEISIKLPRDQLYEDELEQ